MRLDLELRAALRVLVPRPAVPAALVARLRGRLAIGERSLLR
jgi:hypothetical protein